MSSFFHGKVAIVTGAASGIGRAISEALAQEGAKVVLLDVDDKLLAQVTTAIKKRSGEAVSHIADVREAETIKNIIEKTHKENGRLDFVFNNAGIGTGGDVQVFTLEDWNKLIDINIRGVVHGVHAAYPLMVKQGFGHIINTASMAGFIATPILTAYCMTKHAVVGLSKSLRIAAKDFGVKVSAVCPGVIDTPIIDNSDKIGFSEKTIYEVWNMFPRLSPDKCAKAILRGIRKNQCYIIMPFFARIVWWLYRCFPGLLYLFFHRELRKIRKRDMQIKKQQEK